VTSGPEVRVYAYEPWPEFGVLLLDNVRLNRKDEAVFFFNGAVATESGFYDQPHLIRHFRRILGVSPTGFSSRA